MNVDASLKKIGFGAGAMVALGAAVFVWQRGEVEDGNHRQRGAELSPIISPLLVDERPDSGLELLEDGGVTTLDRETLPSLEEDLVVEEEKINSVVPEQSTSPVTAYPYGLQEISEDLFRSAEANVRDIIESSGQSFDVNVLSRERFGDLTITKFRVVIPGWYIPQLWDRFGDDYELEAIDWSKLIEGYRLTEHPYIVDNVPITRWEHNIVIVNERTFYGEEDDSDFRPAEVRPCIDRFLIRSLDDEVPDVLSYGHVNWNTQQQSGDGVLIQVSPLDGK